jgi:hypothetical protein
MVKDDRKYLLYILECVPELRRMCAMAPRLTHRT